MRMHGTLNNVQPFFLSYAVENDKFKSMRGEVGGEGGGGLARFHSLYVQNHLIYMHIIIIDKFMKITFEYVLGSQGGG